MLKVKKPIKIDAEEVYKACIEGRFNPKIKNAYVECWPEVQQEYDLYQKNAVNNLLHLTQRKVFADLTSDNLINLYKNRLVKVLELRRYYDFILASADKCPFCGIALNPKTLDHYLHKNEFPQFAVFPFNLIPCCDTCNRIKGTSIPSKRGDYYINPYYDTEIYDERWLYARIATHSPIGVKFYVQESVKLSEMQNRKIRFHFQQLELSKSYSIKAAEMISNLNWELKDNRDIKGALAKKINPRQPVNYWHNVLIECLLNDQWYCRHGYRQTD